MSIPSPIYLESNIRIAYQLNFSLSCFSRVPLPESTQWLKTLQAVTESDSVRILEYRSANATTHQFLLSAIPKVAPPNATRSIKGRLQYLLRQSAPKIFKRNYRIESVGETNNRTLQEYVGKQPERHKMADPDVQARLDHFQYFDEAVDLSTIRFSAHGQFLYNLHFVFENRERLNDLRPESLETTRNMILAGLKKRDCRVSRIGLAPNHVHVLAACALEQSPLELGLSLMNNLAYGHGMKPVLDYSFYAGTFGNYDRDAIRRAILRDSS